GGQNEIYDDLRLGRTDAVLLDAPIARYYGEIDAALEVLPQSLGEVRYAAAVALGHEALRDRLDQALESLEKDGTLRRIYQRWGIWNAETAALFGQSAPAPGAVAEEFERWRAAVGQLPPFWERVRARYPATVPLFLRGAALTLAVSLT